MKYCNATNKTNKTTDTFTDMCKDKPDIHVMYTLDASRKQEFQIRYKIRGTVDLTEKQSVNTELAVIGLENVSDVKYIPQTTPIFEPILLLCI